MATKHAGGPSVIGDFAQLLDWHLNNGTRPNGKPESPGLIWNNKQFAQAVGGVNERTVRNWRNGRTKPPDLASIESALFGQSPNYDESRRQLRDAFRGTKAARAPDGSTGSNVSVPLLVGCLSSENFHAFEELITSNVDRVIGLKMVAYQSAEEDELQADLSDKVCIFYNSVETQTQISVLDGYHFQHGGYVFDGFFVVKTGGTYQGILTYALKSTDEAPVRLSNVPVIEICL